jgi:hypothetical protein
MTRAAATLVWVVVLVVVFGALLFAGVAAFAYAAAVLLPGTASAPAVAGAFGGTPVALLLGVLFYHRAPRWVQWLRLRRLRSAGVGGTATVAWCQTRHRRWGQGVDSTTVTVRFTWSDSSGEHSGNRRYRFIGDPPKRFPPCVARGVRVPIRYRSGRPDRFVVDIGYAPVMVDQFLR